jgi:DNA-binding response OmpR family regulator
MKKLLLVDDEENVLVGMRRYFQATGFEVDCVRGPAEAEALLARGGYDAVVLDLCLTAGRYDGLDVITSVRRISPSSRILVLTAYGSTETQTEAARRGADLFLQKPRPLDEVAARLRSLLDPGPAVS